MKNLLTKIQKYAILKKQKNNKIGKTIFGLGSYCTLSRDYGRFPRFGVLLACYPAQGLKRESLKKQRTFYKIIKN